MSIKPVAMATVLGGLDPGREPGRRNPNANRFAVLRDRSSSLTGRPPPPLTPVKRAREGEDGPAEKAPRLEGGNLFQAMEAVQHKIRKGKETLEAVQSGLAKAVGLDPGLADILGGLVCALGAVAGAVESIASAVVDMGAAKSPRKATSYADVAAAAVPNGGKAQRPGQPPATTEDLKKRKFVNAVKEAEKSVLVFKLNLGTVPIMNTGTIARKVTEDITAKAAAAEGKTNGRPSEESVLVLEDTLSMVKGMEFFGKVTKSYTNRKKADDPENGTFHTLPVKMTFRDREAKVRAETVLRGRCKLQCTTPYPPRLRSAIQKVFSQQKQKFPEDFIQIKQTFESRR